MNINQKIIKISVRELVEFVYRSGDIDSGYIRSKNDAQKSMMEGIRLHKNIQKERILEFEQQGKKYQKEVSMKIIFQYKNISFEIKGRADGLVEYENSIMIEEIKSTAHNIENLSYKSNYAYNAQAMMYGYIFSKEKKINEVDIHITYINNKDETKKSFSKKYHINEITEFFLYTIEQYYAFVKLFLDKKEQLFISGTAMKFPFGGYRKNQRKFMTAVYLSIKEGKKLFGEAPTGVGKTLSTLYPSIKALCEEKGKKIFYLTSKTITRTVAEESLFLMAQNGLIINSVTITAKDKICVCDETKCVPTYCPRAKGHFDRINNAILDILKNETMVTKDIVLKYSEKHTVCPFEYELDITNFSFIVICDYNYVYNPRVHLKRYFENEKNDFILLVDEAHNLESRARDMFSSTLVKQDILNLRKIFTTKKLKALCNDINKQMLNLGDEEYKVLTENQKTLSNILDDLKYNIDIWLQNNTDSKEFNQVLEIYFNIDNFVKTSTFYDEKYRFVVKRDKNNVTITLLCLDPSTRFSLINLLCHNVVYFSATLTPIDYFSHLFGGWATDYSIKLDSPFERENMLLIKDTTISTFFNYRCESYEPIAEKIHILINGKVGNYFVFFSSYEYLNKVYEKFVEKNPFIKVIAQIPNMGEDSKEWFLNQFSEENNESVVGFLVLGGIFSEGINLVGKKLIGVCIVGVGVGKMNYIDDVVKNYYEKHCNMGYEYAYMFPGMNKVLQGAGRLIRSEHDKGVILLLDNRYGRENYKSLFPEHWSHCIESKDNKNMAKLLEDFWVKS